MIEKVVANIDEVPETERFMGEHWGAAFKPMTGSMRELGGKLGVNCMRVPPGRSTCPFHSHQREDEAFFVLAGRGVLRYGEEMRELRSGDCISCPGGTGIAHQIANPFDEDLVYLAIGVNDPDEVCVYPDNGKVMVRSLQKIGWLENRDYLEGEPEAPHIFGLLSSYQDNP